MLLRELNTCYCQTLGMIPVDFPKVGIFKMDSGSANMHLTQKCHEVDREIPEGGLDITSCNPDEQGNCECQRRSQTPKPP